MKKTRDAMERSERGMDSALELLLRLMKGCGIHAALISENTRIALGSSALYAVFGLSQPDNGLLTAIEPRTLYRISDPLLCRYIILETTPHRRLLIGPYLDHAVTRDEITDRLKHFGLSSSLVPTAATLYRVIPCLSDPSFFMQTLFAFCETIWQTERFSVRTLETADMLERKRTRGQEHIRQATALQFRNIEQLYAFEETLLHEITKGNVLFAEKIAGILQRTQMERRNADPLRNLKNYMIISNTLFRKAAQTGGVHPYYLDRYSSDYARSIEAARSLEDLYRLSEEMATAYAMLVRDHSIGKYPPTIRHAMVYIDSNLSGKLTLKTVAEQINLNPNYLSTMFKKATGKTITAYILQARMAEAAYLLTTGGFSVQTTAAFCGIPDVQYFSKQFKRFYGQPPTVYRAAHRPHLESPAAE